MSYENYASALKIVKIIYYRWQKISLSRIHLVDILFFHSKICEGDLLRLKMSVESQMLFPD